ncbi:hypothetical protein OEZ86_002255 [Tetradesmus obliquus]|nr:hypothetical protein OEZ86_002255 [Tetradesmus obliquus]
MVTANRVVACTVCVLAFLLLLVAAAVDGVRVNGDGSSARRRLAQGNSRRGQGGIGSPCSQPKDCQPQITCCIAAATNGAYDQYNISAREILQAVLPPVLPANAPPECAGYDLTAKTRVWAYGTDAGGSSTHNWPSYTIEATRGKPVQVLLGNELVDSARRYRPHLFADQLDQTLHW